MYSSSFEGNNDVKWDKVTGAPSDAQSLTEVSHLTWATQNVHLVPPAPPWSVWCRRLPWGREGLLLGDAALPPAPDG